MLALSFHEQGYPPTFHALPTVYFHICYNLKDNSPKYLRNLKYNQICYIFVTCYHQSEQGQSADNHALAQIEISIQILSVNL